MHANLRKAKVYRLEFIYYIISNLSIYIHFLTECWRTHSKVSFTPLNMQIVQDSDSNATSYPKGQLTLSLGHMNWKGEAKCDNYRKLRPVKGTPSYVKKVTYFRKESGFFKRQG